jgi:excisionase family DNA binding protein
MNSTDSAHRSPRRASALKPFTVSTRTARDLLDIGNTKLSELIRDGVLDTIRIGRKRLIIYESLERLIASKRVTGEPE